MADLKKIVTTASGFTKTIIATTPANLSSGVSTAQSEVAPKSPNINDKNDANKRYKDLN